MLSQFFHTIYNLIDTLWLGRVGKIAVAATTICWPLIFLMISIGFGLTVAGTALVAQYTGANREHESNAAAGQTISVMLIFALVVGVIGVSVASPLLRLMGAQQSSLLGPAAGYLRTISAGIPAVFGMLVVAALLNGVGDTVTPMKLMAASVALNIILDPVLIFGWGPFPAWGVTGAAVATVIARGLSTVVGFYLLFSGRLKLHVRLSDMRLHWPTVRRIITIGFPASLGQSGTALGFSVMTGILARFGTAVVGAFGIGNRIVSLVLMPVMGLGQATATMVGQNLGAEEPERASCSAWIGMMLSTTVLIGAGLATYLLRTPLMRGFIADQEVIAIGSRMFVLLSLAFPFMGILQVVIGTYQGSGHTLYSMVFSLFRLWVLRIPLVYVLGFRAGLSANGVWWAMLLSNFGTAVVSLGFFLTGNWKTRVIKEPIVDDGESVERKIVLQR